MDELYILAIFRSSVSFVGEPFLKTERFEDPSYPEYFHVEKPFLEQLATLGGMVIDQGHGQIQTDLVPNP